ncbi:MAG: 50S ribosomal protein L10 [Chloroflexia bacterium]|nr:50S ribosomal protein L10 [Chloroflexia bacterium]
MPTEKKRAIVAQLQEDLGRSKLVILTDYRGLNVAEITELRRSLQKQVGGYQVVKNTLLHLALGQAGIEGLEDRLEGPVAVAFAYEDPAAVAKALDDYARRQSLLEVKGGWMEGRVLTLDEIKALASLPSRPVLLAQVMGTIQAPLANLVGGLSSVLRDLIYVLKTRAEAGESAVQAETASAA